MSWALITRACPDCGESFTLRRDPMGYPRKLRQRCDPCRSARARRLSQARMRKWRDLHGDEERERLRARRELTL